MTSEPMTGESLLGFFLRLAELNAHPNLQSLLTSLGWRFDRQFVETIGVVECELELSRDALAAIAPAQDGCEPVRRWRLQRHTSLAVCPFCMADRTVHRIAWRHALVVACPDHGLLLQDTCPACRSRQRPGESGLRGCACGLPFADFAQVPAASELIGLSALLAGSAHTTRCGFPAPLDLSTPADVDHFVFGLAAHHVRLRTGKNGKGAVPKSVAASCRFVQPVADMLSLWPAAFDDEIRRHLAAGDPGSPSAVTRLGPWYRSLVRFRAAAYRPFHDRVADVVAGTFDGSYRGRAVTVGIEPAWIPAAAAAGIIGVRPDRLRDAVAEGLVEGRLVQTGLGHRHVTVRRDTAEAIARARAATLDRRQVAERLGVGRVQLGLLIEARVVELRPADRLPPLAAGAFHDDDIGRLVERIREAAEHRVGPQIPFSEISLRRTTDRSALLDLFHRIGQGQVRAVTAPPDAPLGAFRFLQSDVTRALSRHRPVAAWSVEDAAAVLGVKPQCVAAWIRQGLLPAGRYPLAGRHGYAVDPADLVAFGRTFLDVATAARTLNTTSRAVLARLESTGIPTVGAFQDGGARRGFLVRTSDLLAALLPPQSTSPPLEPGSGD
jgi:hypothetical protein